MNIFKQDYGYYLQERSTHMPQIRTTCPWGVLLMVVLSWHVLWSIPVSQAANLQNSSKSGSALGIAPSIDSQNDSNLPHEPEEFDSREIEAFYDWRNVMFFRQFDLTGSGSVNYMTARRTYKVWLDDFGTPVVITEADPLFYWIDTNSNGKFEQELGEMWSDPYEDGLTGNERPYDSSDLQSPASKVPSWSPPVPSTRLPPCDPRFGC